MIELGDEIRFRDRLRGTSMHNYFDEVCFDLWMSLEAPMSESLENLRNILVHDMYNSPTRRGRGHFLW